MGRGGGGFGFLLFPKGKFIMRRRPVGWWTMGMELTRRKITVAIHVEGGERLRRTFDFISGDHSIVIDIQHMDHGRSRWWGRGQRESPAWQHDFRSAREE